MDHLSCSQMNLYLQCPLKYKFQYIDKLPKPFKASALAFGSALHSALSWLHKHRTNGNNVTLERLFKIFDADWYAQNLGTRILYKNGETGMKLAVMGKEMLSLYFEQPYEKPLAVEMPFVLPFVNPVTGERLSVNFEGYIDLIEHGATVVEFKTSNQTISRNDADNQLQLTGYSYAFQVLYQRPPKCLRLVDFVKNKKPKIVTLETSREKTDCERFFNLAGKILKGIKSRLFFPRSSFMCKDCEYSRPCLAWRGE